ncbi:chromate resistance protein ChrB domain-containing protein [Pedobacter sp.]|jgi:AraC-like DNA-binding protein|uniref:chromate resistance protein ChrB domain-containing protein n=1 Tax=Pedobacter sp. TaxID=1411316 RepID=UPI002C98AF65|nr:chromate resistance protein ChrB domain-containing protein [Pedobacter sp.]HWW41791.1 chromate resistance protein ChrB domain-containing protein [Pedobacter sp.]
MNWITRERPKIDRIACPWLIKKFIDMDAQFFYVPFDQVIEKADELNAIPFDVPGVELTHQKDQCTFDALIKKYNLNDPALDAMAPIVRGADTDQHHLSTQCAGLWAIAAGMAYNIKDDVELLQAGTVIYDALYTWAKHLQNIKHTESPVEQLLVDVYQKFLKKGTAGKIPAWATELKTIIQDQIDTNLALSLTGISQELNVNPAYVSREFSKYFDNLSFGEYIRKLRIEKAVAFIETSGYSLSEIAYLTGFSDQSHFARIFKMETSLTPSAYKKSTLKGKIRANS